MSEHNVIDVSANLPTAREQLTPMEMLGRALENGASAETLEKLMDLQERWQSNQSKAAYDAAMAEMQADLPIIQKKRQGHNFKYAPWGDIVRQIQPVLTKYGFAITHRVKIVDNGVIVTAIASHKDGHREETELLLPFDKTGSKNDVQARGSSIEYGKRYTGAAILGFATEDETDADDADQGYDTTPWTARIIDAGQNRDLMALQQIQADLKRERKSGNIPGGAWKILSSAFAKQMKAIKEPNRGN